MKIGIDTNILLIDNAGACVYTKNLIEQLRKLNNGNEYIQFSYGNPRSRVSSFRQKLENLVRDTLWMQTMLPRKIIKNKIDILHCPAFKAPLKISIPLVVTFYDASVLRDPSDYNTWWRLYGKYMLAKIAKRADKIITISQFSKKDIANNLNIREDKIKVTYCGIDRNFKVIADADLKNKISLKYSLGEKFILYVGALQPRKNIKSLLKAYANLRKRKKIDHELVFVGGTGWRNKDIFLLIKELNISKDVKFLGYIAEDELPIIYNLADFFVYPSFVEGFGMPVLEAFACGCPVIASKTSGLPEVAGDAAIMIDPYSVVDLQEAIIQLANDNSLKDNLVSKGLDRAKMFSWERCAEQTLGIYKDIF